MKGKCIGVGPKNRNRVNSRGILMPLNAAGCTVQIVTVRHVFNGEKQTHYLYKQINSSCVSFQKPRRRSGGAVTDCRVQASPTNTPYLPGTVEPMLCCKLVRLVLRVLAQLHEKMVRQDSVRSPRSEQHRAQHRYESRRCPMTGRSVHRVRLVVKSACPSIYEG